MESGGVTTVARAIHYRRRQIADKETVENYGTQAVPGPRTSTTHRIANNAAATIANLNCLEKNVRTAIEWDESFLRITIIGLLLSAIA